MSNKDKKLDIDLDEKLRHIENAAIDSSVAGAVETAIGATGIALTGVYASKGKLGSFGFVLSGILSSLILVSGMQSINNTIHLLKRHKAIKDGNVKELEKDENCLTETIPMVVKEEE